MSEVKKASVLKPWMNMYNNDIPSLETIECSLNEFLERSTKDYPDNIALDYVGTQITFRELKSEIERTAKNFLALGAKKGDIVTIISICTPEVVAMFYGLELIGVTPNMVDPRTSAEGIKHYIEEVDSKIVVVLDLFYDKVKKAEKHIDIETVLVISPADSLKGIKKVGYKLTRKDKNVYKENVINWKNFSGLCNKQKIELVKEEYDPNHAVLLVHTGGTTGKPKGVLLSARNVNAIAVQFGINGYQVTDKFLNVMPPFIAYGLLVGVHTPFGQAVRSILVPDFKPEDLGKIILKYKPNHMAGVPLHYQTLVNDSRLKGVDLSFIKYTGCGGDGINAAAEKEVNDFFKAHNVPYPLCKGYGMTEVSAAAVACSEYHNKIGSVGFPLGFTTVSMFDPETGEEVNIGEEGEICFKGPNVMLGYYNNQEETDLVMRRHEDGDIWVHSGDVGYMDEDGFIYLMSRIKRVIIRHDGFKIYATNVEDALGIHDDVYMCSAVAVEDARHIKGQKPVAFISLKPGVEKSATQIVSEVKAICEEELPEYTLPAHYEVVESIPMTLVGKIDYKALEKQAAELKIDWANVH